jgi:hypothetical protein
VLQIIEKNETKATKYACVNSALGLSSGNWEIVWLLASRSRNLGRAIHTPRMVGPQGNLTPRVATS